MAATRNNDYWKKRFKRDRPDLGKRVAAGELTTREACIEAGWIRRRTPAHDLRRAWRAASASERNAFLIDIGPEHTNKQFEGRERLNHTWSSVSASDRTNFLLARREIIERLFATADRIVAARDK